MSDDIFIKHGLGAFQQPYIGRLSVNAQEPVIAQRDARAPADARQPGTYQHRSPGTYQLPASAQTPFIRNAQTPNIRGQQQPTIKSAQEPNIRSNQQPVIRDNQTVITYQHRTPTIYQNSYQHQQPSTYQHQSPSISRSPRNYQNPTTYQHRSPDTYPVIARRPVIYQHRSPAITTYRHPTTANVQSTYQVTSQKQNPVIRDKQSPYIFSFRSPFIQGYQTPYSHQQPATGFLPVTIVESVARASEIITGFGGNVSIPNDQNSLGGKQQGASSIIVVEDALGTHPPGDSGSATATAHVRFKIAPISSGSNDYGLYVKSGSGHDFGIGNMSSSSSSSFSYLSVTDTTVYNLIYRLNNIGNGRVQCKLNFPDPTASPYSINTGSGSAGWHSSNLGTGRGYTSGDDVGQAGMLCGPITWPQTTVGTTTNTVGNGFNKKSMVANVDTGSNTLSTSYQNVASSGHGVTFTYQVRTTDTSDANEDGISCIFEFVIKDVDTGTEYTVDLLTVFTMLADVQEEEEDGGE